MRGFRKIISAVMAVGVLMSLTACGDKKNNSSTLEGEPQRTFPNEVVTAKPKEETPTAPEIVAAEDGPRLSIGNTTAKAGEYAEVTLYVENADQNWSFCGIHITFPDVLEVEMFNVEKDLVKFERGGASQYSAGATSMLWVENMPESLTSQNLSCLFFTEIFESDYGLDGDIVTFRMKIPEDAESGTVYPIGFYYMNTDKFQNSKKDLSLEKYAFENWKEGSITVE
ncbi:MAG: hypothetical protein K2J47_05345 [Ruminococcus sp.]|nr:hypothetical protein [Ruminococcus sp.]